MLFIAERTAAFIAFEQTRSSDAMHWENRRQKIRPQHGWHFISGQWYVCWLRNVSNSLMCRCEAEKIRGLRDGWRHLACHSACSQPKSSMSNRSSRVINLILFLIEGVFIHLNSIRFAHECNSIIFLFDFINFSISIILIFASILSLRFQFDRFILFSFRFNHFRRFFFKFIGLGARHRVSWMNTPADRHRSHQCAIAESPEQQIAAIRPSESESRTPLKSKWSPLSSSRCWPSSQCSRWRTPHATESNKI